MFYVKVTFPREATPLTRINGHTIKSAASAEKRI